VDMIKRGLVLDHSKSPCEENFIPDKKVRWDSSFQAILIASTSQFSLIYHVITTLKQQLKLQMPVIILTAYERYVFIFHCNIDIYIKFSSSFKRSELYICLHCFSFLSGWNHNYVYKNGRTKGFCDMAPSSQGNSLSIFFWQYKAYCL
jgi:hypothetical protein